MRDIVATIQREQDEAIRSPASGVTIVSGGPGTGKTAVALHRAAYLLYSDRSRFAGGGILVVGPSAVFVDYIAAVLPSLGEDAATLRSLGSLVAGRHGRPASTRRRLAAVKGSLRMRRVLERAARDAVPDAPDRAAPALPGRAAAARPPAELDRDPRPRRCRRGARRNEVRRAGIDRIFDALWRQAQQLLGVARCPSQVEFDDEHRRAARVPGLPAGLVADAAPAAACWAGWRDPDRLRSYARGSCPRPRSTRWRRRTAELADDGPTVADVALLDELDELLGRPPQPRKPQARPVPRGRRASAR